MKSHPIVFVYLLLFGLALSSCGRPSDEMGRVSIYFPETYYANYGSQQNSSTYVSNLLNIANVSPLAAGTTEPVTNVSDWAPIVPTGYQVGRYDTNCLIVVATGPQLDSHACFKTSAATGTATNVFYFGEMSEPTGIGGEKANLEVLAGSNRVFILLGMHAVSYSDCKKMTDPTFDRSKLSKPYILGKSEAVSVESGKENKFSITVNPINSENYIDYCESTGVSQIEKPPVVRTAGGFQIKIDNPVTENVAYHNQCVPISVKLKDSTGLFDLQSPYTNQFSLITSTGNSPTMYKTGTGCVAATSSDITPTFSTLNLYESKVWIRAASSDSSSMLTLTGAVSDTITVSDGTNSSSVKVNKSATLSFLPDAATKGPMLVVPEKILNGICYPVTFTSGLPSFSQIASINANANTTLATTNNSGNQSAQFLFYQSNDYNCQNSSTTTSVTSSISNNTSRTIYFKTFGFEPGDVINLNYYVSGIAFPLFKKIVIETQDSVVERLAIDGPKDLMDPAVDLVVPANSTNCYGPYRAYLVNKRGAAVPPVNSATQLRFDVPIRFSFNESLGTRLFRRASDPAVAACEPTHMISTSNDENIDDQLGYFEFYVKITERTQTASSLVRYIKIQDRSSSGSSLPEATLQLRIHTTTPLAAEDVDPPPDYCTGGRQSYVECTIP